MFSPASSGYTDGKVSFAIGGGGRGCGECSDGNLTPASWFEHLTSRPRVVSETRAGGAVGLWRMSLVRDGFSPLEQ